MRFIIFFIIAIITNNCAQIKFDATHRNQDLFKQDVKECLIIECDKRIVSLILHSYGGGGGGGGSQISVDDRISLNKIKMCLANKGYLVSKDGIFELPFLNCDY